jgi:addiction module RelE/StbE family toxin
VVKTKAYKILWSNMAKEQLKEIYKHIKKDSDVNAKKVRTQIVASTLLLATGKELYKADDLKQNNKGNYRAYSIYSYRITYKIESGNIFILRVRHTSREPLKH